MNTTADVCIIGGGVIGVSAAFRLAQAGRRVVVLEKHDLAAGASGACDQMVILQSKKPGVSLRLALDGAAMFATLGQELDCDIEYVNEGGMVTIEDARELAVMQRFTAEQRAIGLDVTILDPAEMHRRQRGLGKHLLGCAYSPQDGQVNPLALTLGFARAARRLGAQIRTGTEATGFHVSNGRVTGVKTNRGDVFADAVVLAAGAWSPGVGRLVGLDIPIRPRRGQIAISEPVAPFVRYPMLSAQYIVAKHHPETLRDAADARVRLGVGLALTQGGRGEILIGATREFAGYDTRNTREGLRALLQNAARLLPGLGELHIIRFMAGLRPYTPDGLPLIGFVRDVPGLLLACGHEGDGIALSGVTGRLVKELIVDGRTYTDISALDPDRFRLRTAGASPQPIDVDVP